VLADRLAALLERPLVLREPFRPLDAIVVLGAPLGPRDAMTPLLAERVAAASRPEADVMAAALRGHGIPDVITERDSRSTLDNARMTRPLLEARGVRSLWLVTQPFHARRSARIFRRAGFDAHIWHIDDSLEYSDRLHALRWLVREYAAWLRLFLRGG
jgi:uncharacterized SAM-binding protein YcdF (DUF218 family)